jgi:hypothetical protein
VIATRLPRLSHFANRRVLVRRILGWKIGQCGQFGVELGADGGFLIAQLATAS